MATFYEPRWHAREREARDQERYWELQFSDLDELLRIDRANLRDGEPLTSFGRMVIDVFARVGISPEERREIEAQTRKELLARASQPVDTPPQESDLDPFTASFGGGLSPLAASLGSSVPSTGSTGTVLSSDPLAGVVAPSGATPPVASAPAKPVPGGALNPAFDSLAAGSPLPF